VFWVISVYFNIRDTLPKFCPFLLGHPVYIRGSSDQIQTATCWNLLARAGPPRHLCCRPAVFFRHFSIIALTFMQGKLRCALKKLLSQFFTFQVQSHSREKRLLAAPCPPVCLSACICAAATERIFMKIDFWDLSEKSVKKLHISLKSDKNVGHFA